MIKENNPSINDVEWVSFVRLGSSLYVCIVSGIDIERKLKRKKKTSIKCPVVKKHVCLIEAIDLKISWNFSFFVVDKMLPSLFE